MSSAEIDTIRPASTSSSLGIVPFGFHAKTSFDASEGLTVIRSKSFVHSFKTIDRDIWKRHPPNLSLPEFDPKPPKRNTIDSTQPWRYGTIPGERTIIKRIKNNAIPRMLVPPKEELPLFKTSFRTERPFTAKLKFSREGSYHPGFYEAPKPHDFRGYPSIKSLGLPEFESEYDHDPFNIRFNSDRLNIIHGINKEPPTNRNIVGQQMAPALPWIPKWESRLALERMPWPKRYPEFTRHRRRDRTAHSAFLERAGDQLSTKWAKEKLDEALEMAIESS